MVNPNDALNAAFDMSVLVEKENASLRACIAELEAERLTLAKCYVTRYGEREYSEAEALARRIVDEAKGAK